MVFMVEQNSQAHKKEKGSFVTHLHYWHLLSSQNQENFLHWQVSNDSIQQSWCQGGEKNQPKNLTQQKKTPIQ